LLQNSLNSLVFQPYWKSTAAPAVATNMSITLPQVSLIELVALSFGLSTDANVANRIITVTLETGGVSFYLGSSGFSHTASRILPYFATQTAVANLTGHVMAVQIPIPSIQTTDYAATIDIMVTNMQAGDQLTTCLAMFKMWHGHA